MVPIVAIFATVLLGTTALATDLSITTHYKRSLQNVTDSAALAGARYLPISPALSDEQAATAEALMVVHNSFPWATGGGSWATTLAASGCAGAQCSVTVCAGLTAGGSCTTTVAVPSGQSPFVLTVNSPPKTAQISSFNSTTDTHRIEVVMHQSANAFFANFVGFGTDQDGAQSVAYHFAPNQPFPFALFSNTVIGDGNSPEVITGNIYASRYLAPQSSGHAAICSTGYIVLGALQAPDSGYANDGQSSNSAVGPNADPITNGIASCSGAGSGVVAETTNPMNSAGCQAAYPGNTGASLLTYDTPDAACEANPGITPPSVASVPNLPVYGSTTCAGAGLSGGVYQPGEYKCTSGNSLTIDHPLASGIYEVDPTPGSGGCDVNIPSSSTVTALTGVTFYLKGGAGICFALSSGSTLVQTPYNAGTGLGGDGRYDILSDNVGNPSITTSTSGGGSSAATWQMTGVVWLPTGTVSISNKDALVDDGQIIVNSWQDQSGNHPNPSVTYDSGYAPGQKELLQLAE